MKLHDKRQFYKVETDDNIFYLSTETHYFVPEGFSMAFNLSEHMYEIPKRGTTDLVLLIPLCKIKHITVVDLTFDEYFKKIKEGCYGMP